MREKVPLLLQCVYSRFRPQGTAGACRLLTFSGRTVIFLGSYCLVDHCSSSDTLNSISILYAYCGYHTWKLRKRPCDPLEPDQNTDEFEILKNSHDNGGIRDIFRDSKVAYFPAGDYKDPVLSFELSSEAV